VASYHIIMLCIALNQYAYCVENFGFSENMYYFNILQYFHIFQGSGKKTIFIRIFPEIFRHFEILLLTHVRHCKFSFISINSGLLVLILEWFDLLSIFWIIILFVLKHWLLFDILIFKWNMSIFNFWYFTYLIYLTWKWKFRKIGNS